MIVVENTLHISNSQLMSEMGNLISKMNGTSAELSVGKGVEGIIVRQTNPQELDEVSFAYQDPNDKLKVSPFIYLSPVQSTFNYSAKIWVSYLSIDVCFQLPVIMIT